MDKIPLMLLCKVYLLLHRLLRKSKGLTIIEWRFPVPEVSQNQQRNPENMGRISLATVSKVALSRSRFSRKSHSLDNLVWYFNIKFDFTFFWPCISIHLCNKNQLDALFILSLFRQSTSTCFGHICSPSSGGTLYIYNKWYVLCFLVDCLLVGLWWNQFNTECFLMMGYKYARNV
jgi:hypothetical protein